MLAQMLRAGRLDRGFYNSLVFEGDEAVANAVLLISIMHAIPAALAVVLGVRGVGITAALFFILGALIRWLGAAGGMYLVATRVYRAHGRFDSAVRLAGYAQVAVLPAALLILRPPFSGLLLLAALAWLFATLYVASQALYDLDQQQSLAAAAGGAGGWLILFLLF
jgi:hypothetical protein